MPQLCTVPAQAEFPHSGEELLQLAGRAGIDHLLRHREAAQTGNAEAIHQMRVGVRRLRSILSALSPFLPAEPRCRASGELRWIADELGPARNLDVFVDEILAPARAALPRASE